MKTLIQLMNYRGGAIDNEMFSRINSDIEILIHKESERVEKIENEYSESHSRLHRTIWVEGLKDGNVDRLRYVVGYSGNNDIGVTEFATGNYNTEELRTVSTLSD